MEVLSYETNNRMDQSKELFNFIANKLIAEDPDVRLGKTNSFPGLKFHDKVFAFFHKNER